MSSVSFAALTRNWSWSGIGSIWQLGSRFILTPLILSKIDIEGYGVWVLLFSLSTTVDVLGSSFGQAYIKLAADRQAGQDPDVLAEEIGAGMGLLGGLSVLGLGTLWLLRGWILPWLSVPEPLLEPAGVALLMICFTVCMHMSIGCVREVLVGLQRTDLSTQSKLVSSTVHFVLAWILLERGWGLAGLGISFAIGEVAATVYAWVWCRKVMPELVLSPLRATRAGLRRVLGLGARFQGLYMLTQFTTQGFRMLLSAWLGPAALGVFGLAERVLMLGELGARTIQGPMMAAFASLHASGESARARFLYVSGSRLLFLTSLISFGFLAVFADRIIDTWTGQAFEVAAWTVRALAIAYVAKTLSAMGTADLRARGVFDLEYQYTLLNVGARVGLVLPLAWLFAYEGFVLSGAIALTVSSVWFFLRFQSRAGVPQWASIWEIAVQPLCAVLPVLIASALLAQHMSADEVLAGRWLELARLLAWGVGVGSASLVVTWLFVLDTQERRELTRRVQSLHPKLAR